MKLTLLLLCLAGLLPAQTPTDSQLLLNEVRQLRQDLSAITLASQRVQILLYRLQLADAAMARATQRLDEARNRQAGIQMRRKGRAEQIQSLELKRTGMADGPEKTAISEAIENFKKELETSTPDDQDAQSRQIDAEAQFRAEQAKRDALEAALDKLDKQFAK